MSKWIRGLLGAGVLLLAVRESEAQKTYSGPSPGNWEDAMNWTPNGVPAAGDDVIIPAGAEVQVDGSKKTINSLTLANGAKITGASSGKAVDICTDGDICIGMNCQLRGADGASNERGGDVSLESMSGNVKIGIGSTLRGGDAGSGNFPKKGGSVKVKGKDIDNKGTEEGGNGGDHTNPGSTGGEGGDVTNEARNSHKPGTKTPGQGGDPFPMGGGEKGPSGKGKSETGGGGTIAFLPGDLHEGRTVTLSSPGGSTIMQAVGGLVVNAEDVVEIEASILDLRGNSAGTILVQSGGTILVHAASILTDPGVLISDLMSPAPVVVAPVPALPSWSLALLLAGTLALGVVLLGGVGKR